MPPALLPQGARRKDELERVMDGNDFIFSDDVAESLGSRMTDPAGDAVSAESRDLAVGSDRAGFTAMGGLGFAVLGLMALLGRHTQL